MLGKLKKLTVGDINAFDRYRKDMRKKELIAITREVYAGRDIPDGEISRIEREIQTTQNINDNPEVTLDEIQFLIYRSLLKSNPDISLEDVGQELSMEKMTGMLDKILPTDDKIVTAKKKTVRKKKKKDN
jgi:hypothetical protein